MENNKALTLTIIANMTSNYGEGLPQYLVLI